MEKNDCCVVGEFFKLFSNPLRLRILCALSEGVKTATDLTKELNVSKHNLSQQLKVLNLVNIVAFEKKGRFIYCSIVDKELLHLFKNISSHRSLKQFKKRGK
ncbi:MAG: hypothetical protein A2X86_12525 [Bdellovibrionales bacterium GWA2_49_15]|nr:MAG: hypothetical protein A2X86_12525 [Bdellovibrionales bacterium GWA2_49_15]HAZ14677.1 hypothetical protein [Bdellovibrionales bacterium]